MADYVVPPVAPTRLIFVAFPGTASSEAHVYEDAGEGLEYQKGAYRIMRVTQARTPQHLNMTITPHVEGAGYPGEPPSRAFSAQFLGISAHPKQVLVDGKPLAESAKIPGWKVGRVGAYDALSVELIAGPSAQPVVIDVALVT